MDWPALYELLDAGFPGLKDSIRRMAPLGCEWSGTSTPFVAYDGDRPIAHAGVLEIDLVVEGRPLRVPGIHAVCTHPDHRGRGHARSVIERALAHVDERYGTSILFADVPAMYERFGFRILPQSSFRAPVDPVAPAAVPLRPCDDVDHLQAALRDRAPVSERLGCVGSGYLFAADLVLTRLGLESVHYSADLDAYLVFRIQDGALTLYDVVAREIPPLREILARVGSPAQSVRFTFTPDRFDPPGLEVEPYPEDLLMVRGPWPELRGPFEFPLLAHC